MLLVFSTTLQADPLPSKAMLDEVMRGVAKQTNDNLAGTKVDEFTKLKFVTYDANPPVFSYFYLSDIKASRGRLPLTTQQIVAMDEFHINKTCTSNFKGLLKAYNFKVAHIFEDVSSGKTFYKISVNESHCR